MTAFLAVVLIFNLKKVPRICKSEKHELSMRRRPFIYTFEGEFNCNGFPARQTARTHTKASVQDSPLFARSRKKNPFLHTKALSILCVLYFNVNV